LANGHVTALNQLRKAKQSILSFQLSRVLSISHIFLLLCFKGRNDIQHNDTHHHDTQSKGLIFNMSIMVLFVALRSNDTNVIKHK
jgi:hypothetical protein